MKPKTGKSDVMLQIVLPVHQEGEAIAATLQEIYNVITPVVPFQFIICEDGSTDNTKEVLRETAKHLPMILDLVDGRRGYSNAVIDGYKHSTAPYVLCLDSDGQCEPREFVKFWELKDKYDIIIGWRFDRSDSFFRRLMSGTFRLWHRILFKTRLHDPSCSFLLARRTVIDALVNELGTLKEGFWWEFIARAMRKGFSIGEIPVHHRSRSAGVTVVYKFKKIPGIATRHATGLFRIWQQTR
jgi:dolichol-phosphate mannosyltransferase